MKNQTLSIAIVFPVAALVLAAGCSKKESAATGENKSAKASQTPTEENIGTEGLSISGGDTETSKKEKGEKQPADNSPNPAGGLLDLLNSGLKSVDDTLQGAIGLSVEERNSIGKTFHENLEKELKLKDDKARVRRLYKLAAPIAKHCKSKGLVLRFFVNESDEVNAFSHVGGYIYFNTALLDMYKDDDELQFVIGHEIGHIELGHCSQSVALAARAQQIGGGLASGIATVLYRSISTAYSEEQELEADKWAYDMMKTLSKPKMASLNAIKRFQKHEESLSSEDETEESTGLLGVLESHFCTHPPAKKRLEALEKLK